MKTMLLVRELILSTGRTVIILGILSSFFLAIGYLVAPKLLTKLSEPISRALTIDDWLLGHRIFVGMIFLMIGIALSLTLYYLSAGLYFSGIFNNSSF
jgi:hypothetical protein